jgi:4-amino-4-deoxy-L-arabinose transferase-like glycosyltransferase
MSRRTELLCATLIVALAALLRMGWPGITEFKQDEAHLYSLALSLAQGRAFPLHGINFSVGLPNLPLSVYLYALPLVAWPSPLAATLFVGATNVVAVALAYALTRRYWGRRAALPAALLYAAAPWAVEYSRKLWSNNLLSFFVVAGLFAALLGFVEARREWVAVHVFLLGAAIQIHISAAALAPLTLGLLWAYRKSVNWRLVGFGLACSAVPAVPYGLYLAQRSQAGSGGTNLAGLLQALPLHITAEAWQYAVMLVEGTYLHSLAGAQAFRAFLNGVPDLTPVLVLGGLLALGGASLAAYRALQAVRAGRLPPRTQAGLIVAFWALSPILFFTAHVTPVYPHYLMILFPAPFVLAGVCLDMLLARAHNRWQRVGLWLLPLLIAGSQVWLNLALLRFLGTQNTPGAFGTPLGMLINVAEAAKRAGAEDILVVSDGSDPAVDLAPAVFSVLLHDAPHRFVDARTTAVFPAGPATVILWPGAQPAQELYQRWGGGQWAGTVPLRTGEGVAYLARASGLALGVPRAREASALLANGAELLGSGGDAQVWQLWWRAPDGGAGEDYHVFAHLLDANGARTAQADQATLRTLDWRSGDLVVDYFALGGHGGVVRAGMYAWPSLAPVAVLDAAGNPAGEWIEFPIDP